MALEAEELFVAGTGHIYRAPLGTAFPASISVPVAAPWVDLGYASEEGARFSFGRDVNEIMGWQSQDPLRIVTTSIPKEITVDLMQLNQNTWKTALGGGTWSEPSPGEYEWTPPSESFTDEFAMIVEGTDNDRNFRFCFYRVMNMSGVEFAMVRENPIMLPITVKVLSNDNGSYFVQTDDANLGDIAEAAS
jgi:hypothetical protein